MSRWIIISKDDDTKGIGYYVDLGSKTLESQDAKNVGFSKYNKIAYIKALIVSILYNGVDFKNHIMNNK